MKHRLLNSISLVSLMTLISFLTFAQSTTSSLSGVVVDPNDAVIAGASVTIKNNATSAKFETLTASNGTYHIPALSAGAYTVTVSAANFKQAIIHDVTLEAGVPGTCHVKLEVGSIAESVVVDGRGQVMQTQSANVSTTLATTQIAELPLPSRNATFFLDLLPGVSAPATISPRNSTINGLPASASNITIDGINVQGTFVKEGFFGFITPNLDAIQEVTLSTATPGADSAGQGAVQIKFITRQGSNQWHGSVYEYHRNTALNANHWFANRDLTPFDPATAQLCDNVREAYDPNKCHAPRAANLFNQFGFRLGGPLVLPKKLFGPFAFHGHDRAFFFVNFEEFRQPTHITRTRTILNPLTQAGVFQYNVTVGGVPTIRSVDLIALAARNGQTATIDPVIGKLLADIRSATSNTGGLTQQSNPNLQNFSFNAGNVSRRYSTTARFDFNLTSQHHLENIYNYANSASSPDLFNNEDPAFPGFPVQGGQYSNRFAESLTLRSTLRSNLVNEARAGVSGLILMSVPEINPMLYRGAVANQAGFMLNLSAFSGITNASPIGNSTPQPSRSNGPLWDFADTVTWTRGAHSLSFGGQFTQASTWLFDQTVVPGINFGLAAGDPAAAMFNAANFPNASAANLQDAQNLYAVLTGRVTAIVASAVLDEKTKQYSYLGALSQRLRQREWGLFGQDAWRARPNLTLNFGLRWELQLPFTVQNGVYTRSTIAGLYGVSGPNLFKPGTLAGSPTQFNPIQSGERLYHTDYHDFAPSFGFAWSPNVKSGWLKRLIGENGQTVLRGGYSIAYNREGSSAIRNAFGFNPGLTISATRSTALGNLVSGVGTDVLPVLLSQTSRLGPPAFASAPSYPLTGAITDQVNVIEPQLKTPYTQSWSFGLQREITKDMAVEVRYVHTFNLQQWLFYNFNEVNIVENGFLNEFKLAQANLQANLAAGRGATFRYFGPGTNTAPLPIYLAYFSGVPAAQAADASKYTSPNFSNANFTSPLALNNPNPYLPASSNSAAGLYGNAAFRQNALNAGLPSNFFVINPDYSVGSASGAFMLSNGGYSRYDGLQVDLRRRLSKGLLLSANYTFARGFAGTRFSFRQGWSNSLNANAGGTLHHQFKANWVYELPIGKGKALLGQPSGFAGGLVDKIIGGWQWNGTARIQTGAILNLGNFRLVGMTMKDLQQAYKLRFDDAGKRVFVFPQDIIDNTIKAFSVSATSPTGYAGDAPTGRYLAPANSATCIQVITGDCAPSAIILQGPLFTRFDLSLSKKIKFNERANFEFRAEFLNAFNHINFLGTFNAPSSNPNFGQTAAAYRDINNTQDTGGRLIQLVARINF